LISKIRMQKYRMFNKSTLHLFDKDLHYSHIFKMNTYTFYQFFYLPENVLLYIPLFKKKTDSLLYTSIKNLSDN
jgi:hypothetical protein